MEFEAKKRIQNTEFELKASKYAFQRDKSLEIDTAIQQQIKVAASNKFK